MCALIVAFLTISSSDFYPSHSYTATASVYCFGQGSQEITASLRLPLSGVALAGGNEVSAVIEQDKPVTISWRMQVLPDAPRNQVNSIVLLINGMPADSVHVITRCSSALDPSCQYRRYLPLLRN